MNIFAKSSFVLAFCNTGNFSVLDNPPAITIVSKKSKSAFSQR